MNDILLIALLGLVVTAGLLGMNIVLRIIKAVPLFNSGYPMVHSNVTTPMPRNNDSGLSFNFLLLTLLLIFIYWVFANNNQFTNQEQQIPSQKEVPSEEKVPSEKLKASTQNDLEWDSMPVSYYEYTPAKRTNQAPQKEDDMEERIRGNFYIQLTAVSTYLWAEAFSASLIENNIIIKEGNKFKVLAGPYISAAIAQQQQVEHEELQKGFVRQFTLPYTP